METKLLGRFISDNRRRLGVAAKFGVDNNLARGDPCQTINIFFGPSSSNDSIGFAYLPFFGTYGAYKWSQWNNIECLPIVGKWSNYNLGLVCVHEIGHNLGLLHTWEESALPWTIGILDTSYHTEPNFGGFDWVTSGNPPKRFVNYSAEFFSLPNRSYIFNKEESGNKNVNIPDPVYNVMNYGYDFIMFGFTVGQLATIWETIKNYMPNIWNSGTQQAVYSLYKNRNVVKIDQNSKIDGKLFFTPHECANKGRKCACKSPLF